MTDQIRLSDALATLQQQCRPDRTASFSYDPNRLDRIMAETIGIVRILEERGCALQEAVEDLQAEVFRLESILAKKNSPQIGPQQKQVKK